MAKAPHQRALDVLIHREFRRSRVFLRDGRVCVTHNVAWGFDLGVEVAHITTNGSPFQPGLPIDLFHADEIVRIEDADTGVVLFDHS
jgi:hypothetical protein